jgi:hypothetical protein
VPLGPRRPRAARRWPHRRDRARRGPARRAPAAVPCRCRVRSPPGRHPGGANRTGRATWPFV